MTGDPLHLPESYTALWTAAARARESARPDALFSDPLAELLAGDRGREQLVAREQGTGSNPYLPLRTRFFDDTILRLTGQCPQLVLLGAGMDTRAFRLQLRDDNQVFELDQAEVIDYKQSILGALEPLFQRRTIAGDVRMDWAPGLVNAGFDVSIPTLWVTEGLLFYLATSEVDALLREAAEFSAPGSFFVADVFGTGLLDLPAMQPLVSSRTAAGVALPFCSDEPEALFRSNGWPVVALSSARDTARALGRVSAHTQPEDPERANSSAMFIVASNVSV